MQINEDLLPDSNHAFIMVQLKQSTGLYCETAWNQYTIPFDLIRSNQGEKFILNGDGSVSYFGDKNIKITIHITKEDGTEIEAYPCTETDSYFQEWTTTGRIYASHISFKSGACKTYAKIRPSRTGTLTLTGDQNSPYTFMIIEEI